MASSTSVDRTCICPDINFHILIFLVLKEKINHADNFNQKLHQDFPNLRFHICCLCNISNTSPYCIKRIFVYGKTAVAAIKKCYEDFPFSFAAGSMIYDIGNAPVYVLEQMSLEETGNLYAVEFFVTEPHKNELFETRDNFEKRFEEQTNESKVNSKKSALSLLREILGLNGFNVVRDLSTFDLKKSKVIKTILTERKLSLVRDAMKELNWLQLPASTDSNKNYFERLKDFDLVAVPVCRKLENLKKHMKEHTTACKWYHIHLNTRFLVESNEAGIRLNEEYGGYKRFPQNRETFMEMVDDLQPSLWIEKLARVADNKSTDYMEFICPQNKKNDYILQLLEEYSHEDDGPIHAIVYVNIPHDNLYELIASEASQSQITNNGQSKKKRKWSLEIFINMECIELKDYIADNIMKPEDVDKICKDLAEEAGVNDDTIQCPVCYKASSKEWLNCNPRRFANCDGKVCLDRICPNAKDLEKWVNQKPSRRPITVKCGNKDCCPAVTCTPIFKCKFCKKMFHAVEKKIEKRHTRKNDHIKNHLLACPEAPRETVNGWLRLILSDKRYVNLGQDEGGGHSNKRGRANSMQGL